MSRINYIKNPSFKNGRTDFWAPLGDGAVISSETDTAHFGEHSLRVQKASGIFKCGTKISGYRIPVTAGSTYTTSAYIRMPEELESRTYTCKIDWYSSAEGGEPVGSVEESIEIFNFQVSGLGFISVFATGVAPLETIEPPRAAATHAEISIYQEEREIDASAQPFRFFYIDSVLFEESAFIKGFFESITQEKETASVNKTLSPVPYPEVTGMELNADINLNGLIFNTVDEDGILWVCTDLQGWWGNSEPEVANITRGLGDGSYDVRGRYAAREIEFSGVFLPPNKELITKAREKLIAAIDLVKTNGWLIVDEEPPRASQVRLVDRPEISTVNSRGRTEFSFTLRAHDPIKYEWIYGDQDGRNVQQIQINSSFPIVNAGNSPVPAVFELHGPMEVGTFIRNLANQQTMALAQRLRGANETTEIVGVFREQGIATVRTNTSPNIVVGDFVTVSGVNDFFDATNSLVTSVIDDEDNNNYQIGYVNDGEDFIRLFITGKSFSNNVATLTVTPDTIFTANTAVVVAGVGDLFNGIHFLDSSEEDTLTYTKAVAPTSIIAASRVNNVATITTTNSLGVLVGDSIAVSDSTGQNFNTASQTVLSVIDTPSTNTFSLRYTSDFANFGRSQVTNKFLGSDNVATLNVTPNYLPTPINANGVAKLNADGSIDTSFATNIGTGADNAIITSAIQSDGKIIFGGFFTNWSGSSVGRIVRLNADGTADSTFATNIGFGANSPVFGIDLQSDQKIIVVGRFRFWNNVAVGGVVRLNADGTRDTTFTTNNGTGANVSLDFAFNMAVDVQSDDKIVIGGEFTTWNGATVGNIVRLNADGTRDTTFSTNVGTGSGGSVPPEEVQFDFYPSNIKVQSDQKILVAGFFTTWNGVTVGGIVRLNPDGTRDTTFSTNVGTGSNDVSAMAIQSNEKILISIGQSWNGVFGLGGSVRLNTDGTRDTSFSGLETGFGFGVTARAVEADGKIIIGSASGSGALTGNNILQRTPSNGGSVESAFSSNMGVGPRHSSSQAQIRSILVLPDDKIIISGSFRTGPSFFRFNEFPVLVSGVDSIFDGIYQLLPPLNDSTANSIRYTKTGNVSSTTVTSPTALVQYSPPAGSVVTLSGVNSVNSENAFVEYATVGNPLLGDPKIGLADGDILEIDTYLQEVALNGNAFGKRFYLETLAEWVSLEKGSNSIQVSYLENPITQKSISNDVATIVTFQSHRFRVGDSVKIQGVDNIFDGIVTVTVVNSPTSFSFSLEREDVPVTAVTAPTSVVAFADSHAVIYYRSGWLG